MKFKLLIVFMCTFATWPVLAQIPTPSPEQMIEQLKAPIKTRKIRNLSIEATQANRPSLSLLIQFDFDSAKVRPESQQALANLALALSSNELKASRFAIEGHTDAKGGAQYNLRLSELRAKAVCDFLKSKGIVEERLVPSGKGSSELTNKLNPEAAENRRVLIVNLD
jgi:OOP family OmpA-OmpF porin